MACSPLKAVFFKQSQRSRPQLALRMVARASWEGFDPLYRSLVEIGENSAQESPRDSPLAFALQHVEAADRERRRIRSQVMFLGELRQSVSRPNLTPGHAPTIAIGQITVVLAALQELFSQASILLGAPIAETFPGRHPPGHTTAPSAAGVRVHETLEIRAQTRLEGANLDLIRGVLPLAHGIHRKRNSAPMRRARPLSRALSSRPPRREPTPGRIHSQPSGNPSLLRLVLSRTPIVR